MCLLAVNFKRLVADGNHRKGLNGAAIVPDADFIAVLNAFFFSQFFGNFNERSRHDFDEPRNVAGLCTGLPVFADGVRRCNDRELFAVAAFDGFFPLRELNHRAVLTTVHYILRRGFVRFIVFGQRTVFHRVAEQTSVLFPSHEEGLVVRRNRNNLTVFDAGFDEVADVVVNPAGAVPFDQHLIGVPRFAVHVGRCTVVKNTTVGRPREGEFAVKAQSGRIG